MKYSIFFTKKAQKESDELPDKEFEKIDVLIKSLAVQPRPSGCLKLINRNGWRIRKGDYRILYDIDDSLKRITIFRIGHRRHVYDKRQ